MNITATGVVGELLEREFNRLHAYSPFLGKSLDDLKLGDGEVLLGADPASALESWSLGETTESVLYLGADAEHPLKLGGVLGSGRITAVGGSQFSLGQARTTRASQRFLPLSDVDFKVGLATAVSELLPGPVSLFFNLNLFSSSILPNIEGTSIGGVTGPSFLSTLAITEPLPISRLSIWAETETPDLRLGKLGAEVLRELLLAWWPQD